MAKPLWNKCDDICSVQSDFGHIWVKVREAAPCRTVRLRSLEALAQRTAQPYKALVLPRTVALHTPFRKRLVRRDCLEPGFTSGPVMKGSQTVSENPMRRRRVSCSTVRPSSVSSTRFQSNPIQVHCTCDVRCDKRRQVCDHQLDSFDGDFSFVLSTMLLIMVSFDRSAPWLAR